MKRKGLIFLTVLLLLCFAAPAQAAAELTGLQINEDLVPGPDSFYLTVTGLYSDGTKRQITEGLSWFSSDTDIATVANNGRVHFTGKGGPVTITVYKGAASGSKSVTVKPWPKSLDIEGTLAYSENQVRLSVVGRFSDGTTRYFGPDDPQHWTTSNAWVAWVNNQGVVTFTGENGKVTIRVVSGKLSDSVNTTVDLGEDGDNTAYRKGIRIEDDIEYSSDPVQLSLVALYSDDTEVSIDPEAADWSSSNNEVAFITNSGELHFTGKAGYTTIKVSFGGYTYEKLVSVGSYIEKISINQTLNYTRAWEGVPLQLSATALYNDGREFITSTGLNWKVDNPKVATITKDGLLTFSGQEGSVTVTVSADGLGDITHEDTAAAQVTAYPQPVAERLFIDCNPVGTQVLSPVVNCSYSDGSLRDVTKQVQWITGSPQVSVFQGQIYFAPQPGPVSVTAVYNGLREELTGYIPQASGSAAVVKQIRIKEHQVPYRKGAVKLTGLAVMGNGAIRDVTSNLVWKSSRPLVATVKQGILTFTGQTGTTNISIEGYGLRDQISLEVKPADLQPRIEKLILEGKLEYSVNQLKATAVFNDGLTRDVTREVIWNSSNKNVAAVNAEGAVMFPRGPRPVTITAHYQDKGASITRP